jgi:hypothetical protein
MELCDWVFPDLVQALIEAEICEVHETSISKDRSTVQERSTNEELSSPAD